MQGGTQGYRLRIGLFTLVGVMIWNGCSRQPRKVSICEIQGPGPRSPFTGETVRVEGIISSHPGEGIPPGFALEADCSGKEERAGIWISLDQSAAWLSPGDEIRLEGLVAELDLETRIQSSLKSLEILSLENPLAAGVDLAESFHLDPLSFSYEAWEGRPVILEDSLVLLAADQDGFLLICPIFQPSLLNSLGCQLGSSYYLRILVNPPRTGVRGAAPGELIQGLKGILRQDGRGYYIQPTGGETSWIKSRTEADLPLLPTGQILAAGLSPTMTGGATITPGEGIASGTPGPEGSPAHIPSPTWYPIPLLLSEVMPDPAGKEPDLEWIELFNPSDQRVPLDGLKLGDEVSPGGNEGTLRFPEGYFIEAGEVMVIGQNGSAFQSRYGFFPDFEILNSSILIPDLLPYPEWGGSQIQLSNSGDEVLLLDPWDGLIDQLAYGSSSWSGFYPPAEAPPEGGSLERFPPERDRNLAGDWRIRQAGSPGWLDRSLPTALPTPTAGQPSPTLFPSLTPTPLPSPALTSSAAPTVSPTSTLNPSFTSTPLPIPTLTNSPALSVSPSSTLIPSATPSLLADPSLTPSWSVTATIRPTLTPTLPATLDPSCTTTPAAVPTLTPTPPDLFPLIVINEIHADPHPELGDANGDGEADSASDEFIELVNPGDQSLDLSAWEVRDEVRVRFIFPEGSSLGGGCGLVLFGGEAGFEEISGSLVFSAGPLGLNNTGDTVSILDGEGNLVAEVGYGPEGGEDQSLTCYPDLASDLPLALHAEIPEASGRLFSPGTRLDGSLFGNCP